MKPYSLPPDLPFREFINDSPAPEVHLLRDNGTIPNNAKLPLLILRGALRRSPPGGDGAEQAFERIFARNRWLGSWRNGIYSFHHYHSTSHEALGVARGHAGVRLGGEAGGITATLNAGDLVVIPAGVGHCNLGASADFSVVGAYPDGRKWDLCRGLPGERPKTDENIAAVPLPDADPFYGNLGPLAQIWRDGAKA